MRRLRIAIVSADSMTRLALRQMVEAAEGMKVVGELIGMAEVQELCTSQSPSVLLLDATLPGLSLQEIVTRIDLDCPDTQIILLTSASEVSQVREAVRLRVRGVLDKQVALQDIEAAIQTVAMGGLWLRPGISAELMAGEPASTDDKVDFTPREREVLSRLARGWSNPRIGNALYITERTVRAQLRTIYDKIEVDSRGEAIVWAVERGYHRQGNVRDREDD